MAIRGIKKEFVNELKNGSLEFFLDKIKNEPDKYVLGIRKNYINIYYRGGNILRIRWHRGNRYSFKFDIKYCKNKKASSKFEPLLKLDSNNAKDFIENFELMRLAMDYWFEEHRKKEREYQQRLFTANDCVIDIEYAIGRSMRLDMIIVTGETLIVVENKYGIGAIKGNAGIRKHYEDFLKVFDKEDIYNEMLQSIANISQNMYELGLTDTVIDIQKIKNKKIIFLMAGYNSQSILLDKQIEEIKEIKEKKYPVDILFMNMDEYDINLNKAQPVIR